MKTSGIYVVVDDATGEFYLGSTKTVERRWIAHRSALRCGTHYNKRLMEAWRRDGEAAFRVEVVCLLDEADLRATERRLLTCLLDSPLCCNATAARTGQSTTHSPEHRAKNRTAHRGQRPTAEAQARMRAAARIRFASAEERERMRAIAKAQGGQKRGKRPPEVCERIRQKLLGRHRPPDVLEKLRAGHMAWRRAQGHDASDEGG